MEGEKIESKSEFNGGKERRSRNGLPIFGNFRFVNCSSSRIARACPRGKLVLSLCKFAMDACNRPPPPYRRFIEYDNSRYYTRLGDFLLPSNQLVYTLVFNFLRRFSTEDVANIWPIIILIPRVTRNLSSDVFRIWDNNSLV